MSALELEVLGAGGTRTPLPKSGAVVLGSSPRRAGLVLRAPGVDEAHAAVGRLKDGGWALRDLGSEGGTTVNGERVASVRLSHGDVIAIGEVRVRVVDPARPAELVRDATAEAPPPMPERLGGFRIEKRLGRGGMGDVYLAVQESLSRPVALKVLSRRLDADAEFVRRFEIEARAAAILNHPNVVVVHDVGFAEGHHYLAMEYMDRGNLEERITRNGAMPWREAVDVLHDAGSGLVYAEEHGIVHRDIKPANLMRNAAGATKIADLGLAATVEGDGGTGGGPVFGTPHFISPEQARGEKPDRRSDLYSLGATLYRLLSGKTPFEGETTRDILRAHFQQEPEPLVALVPEIPAELSELVAKLLAKDPADRPQSATEVVAAARRLRAAAEHGAAVGSAEIRTWVAPLLVVAAVVAVLSGLYVGGVLGGSGGTEPAPPVGPGPLVGGTGAVGPPALPEGATGSAGPATDDMLRLAEREAELDLREIELRSLAPAALRDALRDLAARHEGTAVAEQSLVEAQRIDEDLAAEAAAAAARLERLEVVRAALGELPEVLLEPPQPATALAALAVATGPEELDPAELDSLRAELAAEIVARAIAHSRDTLDAADEAASGGDFDSVQALLAGLAPVLASVPESVPLRPPGLGEMHELARETAHRLEGLAAEREAYARAAATTERAVLAGALTGMDGLEGDLRELDLVAARNRMDALAESLVTPELMAIASRLSADITGAGAALEALIAADIEPGWRRHSVIDPRDKRGAFVDATSVDRNGIGLEDGTRIPWADFAAAPGAVLHLFRGRLDRDWTESEARGVATLLRIAGAIRALDEVAEVLGGSGDNHFRTSEAEAVQEAFRPLEEWAAEQGMAHEVEAEARAARELALACLASSEENHAEAVARLEHLLEAYPECLVVLFLSDGGGMSEPAAGTAPPPDPGNGSSGPGSGSGGPGSGSGEGSAHGDDRR